MSFAEFLPYFAKMNMGEFLSSFISGCGSCGQMSSGTPAPLFAPLMVCAAPSLEPVAVFCGLNSGKENPCSRAVVLLCVTEINADQAFSPTYRQQILPQQSVMDKDINCWVSPLSLSANPK